MQDRPSVFVVDDEALIADSFAAILRMAGISAESFHDGESALRRARSSPPELLLSDVGMPRMDGFTLAEEMKRISPTCHVILFSGKPHAPDAKQQKNVMEIMAKPVPAMVLIEKVRAILGF